LYLLTGVIEKSKDNFLLLYYESAVDLLPLEKKQRLDVKGSSLDSLRLLIDFLTAITDFFQMSLQNVAAFSNRAFRANVNREIRRIQYQFSQRIPGSSKSRYRSKNTPFGESNQAQIFRELKGPFFRW
jgi:hypothetical protein